MSAQPHRRPGPGRPPRAKGVGPVYTRRAKERVDKRHRGTARTLVEYLERYTGDSLPGFACLRAVDVMAAVGLKSTQLYHLRAKIAADVQTRGVRGLLYVWSPSAAYARTKEARWSAWRARLADLELAAPTTPFLGEMRAWLEHAARGAVYGIPQRYSVSTDTPESAVAAGSRSPAQARAVYGIPQRYSVSTDVRDSTGDAGAGFSVHPKNIGVFWGLDAPDSLRFSGVSLRTLPQRYSVSTAPTPPAYKLGREIQASSASLSSAPFSSNPDPLSLSGSARSGFKDEQGAEREGAVPAPRDTVTADHGGAGGQGARPASERRLRPSGGVPVVFGAIMDLERLRAPETARWGAITPTVFRAAFVAAMGRAKPGWRLYDGYRNDDAIEKLCRTYCEGRPEAWLGRWLETQVARFAADVRHDRHQATGLVLFLEHFGTVRPPPRPAPPGQPPAPARVPVYPPAGPVPDFIREFERAMRKRSEAAE